MLHPGADMVVARCEEHLCLMFEPSKRGGMYYRGRIPVVFAPYILPSGSFPTLEFFGKSFFCAIIQHGFFFYRLTYDIIAIKEIKGFVRLRCSYGFPSSGADGHFDMLQVHNFQTGSLLASALSDFIHIHS